MSHKDDRKDIELNEARNLSRKERMFNSADSIAMTHIDDKDIKMKSKNNNHNKK